jgi:FkbM family methyltransferase
MSRRGSNSATKAIRRLLERFEVQVGHRRHTLAGARERLLREAGVELAIDVGAHTGEYGRALRAHGYAGAIVSFEPVRSHFERLAAATADDGAWECRNLGVGADAASATINVSGNDGFSSSLLAMNESHERAVVESRYEGTETIELVSLDQALPAREHFSQPAYLKIDAQGYEHEVLDGAENTLRRCRGVELELSLTALYDGQALIGETIELMRQRGFRPTHLEPEFIDPGSGELLQVNGLFQPLAPAAEASSP